MRSGLSKSSAHPPTSVCSIDVGINTEKLKEITSMQTINIRAGCVYRGARWKGDRKVVSVVRHRGQDSVVHYIDLRTKRTGNAMLTKFSQGVNFVAVEA